MGAQNCPISKIMDALWRLTLPLNHGRIRLDLSRATCQASSTGLWALQVRPPSGRMLSARYTKLIQEYSRRKKAKCPGEQPVCSLCARLRQQCVYADERRRPQRSEEPARLSVSGAPASFSLVSPHDLIRWFAHSLTCSTSGR
jgi:Fungal Zn(2)-Cys(6) binuclear cluster domain.